MMKEGLEGFLMAESDGVVCFAACLRFNNHNPELGFAGFADSGTQPKNQKAEKESVLDCERKPRPFFLNASLGSRPLLLNSSKRVIWVIA